MGDYCVYCHTNISDGKKYFGITCQKPQSRWRNGNGYLNNRFFYRAICKYGWEGFRHEILATNLEKTVAEKLEIDLIEKHETTNPDKGYNIEAGGNSTEKFTSEIRKKISESLKGHECTEETKMKIRLSKIGKSNGQKGRKASPEAVEANRKGHLGQTPWNKGRPWTREEKAKCNGKAVLCVETQIVYMTAHEAAEALGIDFSQICKCRRGTAKTAGGYHWLDASEEKGCMYDG